MKEFVGLKMDKLDKDYDDQKLVKDELDDESVSSQSDMVETQNGDDSDNINEENSEVEVGIKREPKVTVRGAVTLAILVFINLLNYMDRYTIAGICQLPTFCIFLALIFTFVAFQKFGI